MDLSNKRVMVIGLGKSGARLLEFLDDKAMKVLAFDNKNLQNEYDAGKYHNVEFYFGQNPSGDESVDIIVISPGIPLELDFVAKFKNRNIEIIGEIELAYNFAKGSFVSITGTNGKTTTTTLVGKIFENAGFDTRVVGNIGNPIISEVENSDENTVFVSELSSFQLETIKTFHSKIATIVNITPDHLNRHKTMENYANIKFRIFENQNSSDFAIMNIDDSISLELSKNIISNKIYVTVNGDNSSFRPLILVEDGKIVLKNDSTEIITDMESVKLKGKHNLENVLIAVAMTKSYGISNEAIEKTLKNFTGVEHRLEPVRVLNGVTFVNDSKGTNPDASIKAIEAIENDIILIAGGMDKKSEFDEFVKIFDGRVKKAILLGETKEIIARTLEKYDFDKYIKVFDMNEAVEIAFKEAEYGDTVLLSPACASWDMYSCFEERGEHFKSLVNELS